MKNDARAAILRILIVDDSLHDRAEAKAALLKGSTQRYAFVEAASGEAALRICRQLPAPDCVVLDFELPDANALHVLAHLPRDADDFIVIPVVILTGSTSSSVNQEVLRAGAQDYVGKSWLGPESLTRAVENAIERHAMLRQLRHDRNRQQLCAEVAQAAAGSYTDGLDALLEQVRLEAQADVFMHYVGDGINGARMRLQRCTGIDPQSRDAFACLPLDQVALRLHAHGAHGHAACPLMVDGRMIGMLHFATQTRACFDASELSFIALVGRQISGA